MNFKKVMTERASKEGVDGDTERLQNINLPESIITSDTVTALTQGSHEAYRKVYFAYKESIEAFLIRLTRSEEEAQDITQDIFVNVWEKRCQIDPSKSIKSYLFSIARNSAINYFQHEKVKDRYHELRVSWEESTGSLDETLIARETELLIRIAVSRMPRQRRTIFQMSQYQGMSHEEIALKLNMNKMTVANHISNARKDIKEILTLFILLFFMR